MENTNQWSSAKTMLGNIPAWVQAPDNERVAAYGLYENIYWTAPDALQVIQRSDDLAPIYIPSGRQIVDTLQRYLAPGLGIITDPMLGSDQERALAQAVINSFARRERLYSKFNANKRLGITRGDWLWHLYADPTQLPGSRISIFGLDPASYFPILNPDNEDELIGCHLVKETEFAGKPAVYRLTYRKATGRSGPSPITVEAAVFEPGAWGQNGGTEKILNVTIPSRMLPEPINQLPVYHIPHYTGSFWGSSELRGLERLLAAINQNISDEDLSIAMDGLGVYSTTAGEPVDAQGNPVGWNIGPAKVVEIPEGSSFNRTTGVSSVAPFQDHLTYLHNQLDLTSAQPSVAKGRVSVEVAESGIALLLEMAPILSRSDEKQQIVTDVMTNLLFDLKAWFEAYESINIGEAVWIPTYSDKIPLNRKERFDEIMSMQEAGLVSAAWARSEIAKLGYSFPEDTVMMDQIMAEKTALLAVESAADPFNIRIDKELSAMAAGSDRTEGPFE